MDEVVVEAVVEAAATRIAIVMGATTATIDTAPTSSRNERISNGTTTS